MPHVVKGFVRETDGTPIARAIVQAFDQELRSLNPLGQAATGPDGSYQVSYEIAQLKRPGKAAADVVVKAVGANGEAIAQSATLFQAPPNAQVDLTRGNQPYLGPAEHNSIQTRLAPVLGTVKPAELNENDIAYLAGDSGIDTEQIRHFAVAAQAGATAGVDSPVFYGLARKGFPPTLDRLLATDPEAQRQTLAAAARDNLIPPSLAHNIPQVVAQLQQAAVSRTIAAGATRLGGTLSIPLADAKLQTAFLNTFLANRTSGEDFWAALAKQPGFTADTVGATQLAVQLGSLTQYHTPLVQALVAQHQQGKIKSLSDLARLQPADWVALLDAKNTAGGSIGAPAGVPGANAAEQAQNYAEALSRRLETAFPTVAVSARLATSKLPAAHAVAAFLDAHPAFDITGTNAVQFLETRQVSPEVAQALPVMQRVYKVASRYDHMEALLSAGIHSARSIAQMPLELFQAQFGTALGGVEEAAPIYARAQLFTHSAVQLYAQYASTLSGNDPRVIADALTFPAQIPNWTALFGSPDFCACSDCQSILSPAAYMVDLLNQFVDPFIADNKGHKGTALLFSRRPDINTLQLSCENTNTTLPYIDLVNELLEDAVSPGTAVPHDSTDGQPADLMAVPEYLNQKAYDILAGEVFPWGLPFDLGLSQARGYLSNLKVQRSALMQALQASPSDPDPTDGSLTSADAVACESLGLSPLGWKILTGASGHQPWDLWGVAQADWLNVWTKAAPGPTVQQFLTQAGIEFDDFVDLLTTRYAARLAPAPHAVAIQWDDSKGESCDLSQAKVLNLSAPVLDGFLRFLRLRNALGASVLDTDKLLGALAPASIDAPLLRQAAVASQMQASTQLPWPELASWWGNIPAFPDSAGGTSLYQRLFLNPAITNPLDAAFGLTADGSELADTSHFLEDAGRQSTLLAGLQISATDLALLVGALPLQVSGGKHVLNLGNLSELYRAASMARALALSVADFLAAAAILNLNLNPVSGGSVPAAPFDRTRIADARWTIDQLAWIQRSGFSLADLGYLLLDVGASSTPPGPSAADLAQQLTNLSSGLAPILAKTGGANPDWSTLGGALVSQQLAGWLGMPVPSVAAWLAGAPSDLAASYLDTFLNAAFLAMAVPIAADAVAAALRAPVPPNPAAAPPLYYQARALIKLKKSATFVARLSLQAADLTWLSANAAALGWLDFTALPAFGAAPPPLYGGWVKLVTMAQLRAKYAAGQPLQNLMPVRPPAVPPAENAYLAALSALTKWNLADLETVCGAGGLRFTYPADFWNPATFNRIQTAMGMLGTLGATASQVLPWAHAAITQQQANDITTLIKGHYSVAQWPDIGKKLRDPLRQQQRDALAAYLVFHSPSLFGRQFTTPDDLFGYFLIDTQMSSCMQTSRIIQATQSIQTFISRAFLNLESNVTVSPQASRYWTWMKQYRLWQANREVFLYPENWLDPSLRDDQTSFFKTMVGALRKDDANQDAVETAYLNYLTSLDGVARLVVSGMYHDLDPANAIDTVYVFARTQSAPNTYYLRQFVNSSYWTEWEKVDLDIPGCDVIPVIYNRRLYVFWPVMKTIGATPSTMSAPNPGDHAYSPTPTPRWIQIQMAWSQYWQGKWVAKKISDPPGLLIPVWPTLSNSGLVPSANEANFGSSAGTWPQAVRPDGSVDASYFSFKAVPPAAGSSSDEMHIHCYVVN